MIHGWTMLKVDGCAREIAKVVLGNVQVAIMKQFLYGAYALRGNGIIVEFDHYRVVNQDVVALISG